MFRIDKKFVSYQPHPYVPPAEEAIPLAESPQAPEDPEALQAEEEKTEPDEAPEPDIEKKQESGEGAEERDRIDELMQIAQEELERAENKAAQTLKKAQAQADAILEQAKVEAEGIRDSAYKDGCEAAAARLTEDKLALDESIAQRERELQSRQQEDAAMVGRLISEIGEKRDALFDRMEDELLDFSLSLAKKVVNLAVEKENSVYEAMCIKAIRQLKWDGKITLKVSKREYERFFMDGKATYSLGDETVTATVEEDEFLEPGDLIVETVSETIDAGVETQFKRLEIAFHDLEK